MGCGSIPSGVGTGDYGACNARGGAGGDAGWSTEPLLTVRKGPRPTRISETKGPQPMPRPSPPSPIGPDYTKPGRA